MATTTATFNISSTDLTDNALSVTNIATLTKAGNEEGLDTVISATKTFTATGAVDLVTVTGFTTLNANKVYIANTGDSSSEYFIIGIESEEVGNKGANNYYLLRNIELPIQTTLVLGKEDNISFNNKSNGFSLRIQVDNGSTAAVPVDIIITRDL